MMKRDRGHIINVASMAAFATNFAVQRSRSARPLSSNPKASSSPVSAQTPVTTPMLTMHEHHDASSITSSGGAPLSAE